jgi:hypothetical protein
MSTTDDFSGALRSLARAGVDFMVVGVVGINFYARDPEERVITQDLDVWLRPEVTNLSRALLSLQKDGFRFEAGGEPFVDLADDLFLQNVIRSGGTIVGRRPPDVPRLDLMLALHDFSFEKERDRGRRFLAQDEAVRVASVETLLLSKERAGRPKDIEFLRMHAARFREQAAPAPGKKKTVRRAAPKKRKKQH